MVASTPGTLSTGVVIEGYQIDGILGEGGMGVVYEATQLSLDRKVALKLIASDLSDDSVPQPLRARGPHPAAIDHPHIVTVYEAGESKYGLFIAMRLIRGSTLKGLILGASSTPAAACAFSVRSRTRSIPPTRPASSTATSSLRTSSSAGPEITATSPTSAS